MYIDLLKKTEIKNPSKSGYVGHKLAGCVTQLKDDYHEKHRVWRLVPHHDDAS